MRPEKNDLLTALCRFQLVGVTCLALGVYLCAKDLRAVVELVDVVLNPAVMLVLVGLIIGIVSLMGSIGALRDNICLLKSVRSSAERYCPLCVRRHCAYSESVSRVFQFALTVFFCYIMLVVATFVLFILFYSDTTEGMSAHSVLLHSIKRYHQNKNLADFIDYVQEQVGLQILCDDLWHGEGGGVAGERLIRPIDRSGAESGAVDSVSERGQYWFEMRWVPLSCQQRRYPSVDPPLFTGS
jgi:hypothetical protein